MAAAPERGATVVTVPSDNEILVTREFGIPKHPVYKAWTTPELLKQWWSASRGEMTVAEIDLRVGGAFRYAMVADDGVEFGVHGEYLVVVPDERLVYTEVFEVVPPFEVTITAAFTENHRSSTMTLLVTHPSQETRDRHLNSGKMAAELQGVLDGLEQVASSLQ